MKRAASLTKPPYDEKRDWSHMLFIDYTLRRFLIVLVEEEDGCSEWASTSGSPQ